MNDSKGYGSSKELQTASILPTHNNNPCCVG